MRQLVFLGSRLGRYTHITHIPAPASRTNLIRDTADSQHVRPRRLVHTPDWEGDGRTANISYRLTSSRHGLDGQHVYAAQHAARSGWDLDSTPRDATSAAD